MYWVEGLKSKRDFTEYLDGELIGEDKIIEGISFDTRTIKPNELFIPLEGANFSGKNFVNDALDKDAIILNDENSSNSIVVDDIYTALIKLCQKHIDSLDVKLILVTGSYGKTTIKEMIKHASGENCHSSLDNQNNEYGIPYTILSCPKDVDFLVVECGARKIGDFDILSKILISDALILSDIAPVHLETFENMKNIESTKLALKRTLKDSGIFIDGRAIEAANYKEKNLKLVSLLLNGLNIPIEKSLESFQPTNGRGKVIEFMGGKIIDHTYNASPKTLKETVAEYDSKNTILVLGDMAELGPNELNQHIEILDYFNDFNIWVTGPIYREARKLSKTKTVNFFEGEDDFPKEELKLALQTNNNLYFKGSRSSKMERFIKMIIND